MSEAVIALIATLMGASGLKFIEWLLGRSQRKQELDLTLRNELRADVEALRSEILNLKKEIDDKQDDIDSWRERYFKIVQELYKHGIGPSD
jgi:uncharacterized coiled-coil DUF342 family protein